ncbi:MAG: Gfo/Idh/MocA family protein [Anaerolineales bacterium]
MASADSLKVGVVGSGGRGGSFERALDLLERVRVRAVCDVDREALEASKARLGAQKAYTHYEEMLEAADVDAVIVGTPMPLHVPEAIAALEKGIHVLSEVPAGISIEECRELVAACQHSKGVYMMAENYIYSKANMMVTELVRQGLFGETYYAEGEYIHELKALNEETPWRRKWQTGINGVTYGTHSLGPILQWMPGDRVTSVCCAGSGHHYRDPRGDFYENEDSCVMLCKMASDGLVKIRVDMVSDRPHAMHNHSLQGVDGCYESARAPGERDRIWLRSESGDPNMWLDLEALEAFVPREWRESESFIAQLGHGGGDYFVIKEFVEAVMEDKAPRIGIHEAMDMTLPGLVSQRSITQGGKWLPVPDSRTW